MDPLQLLGKRLSNYEVLELIGKGGMGFVFRARDVSLDREVALKVLRPELSEDKEFESRFVREARNAAKVDHPSIVQVYSAGKMGNLLFMAMQFVKGDTVSKLLEDQGKFEWTKALKICKQVLKALHIAHRHGFIHRDLKPTNIMVDDHGTTKIMDFGLMKHVSVSDGLTKAGVYYGTPEYSSPEQCQTQELDARSDIYSLGAVLYEMLTGRLPHVAEEPLALFRKIEKDEPISIRLLNPNIPKEVSDIIHRMMHKDPQRRYQAAEDVLKDIDKVLKKTEGPRRKFIPYIASAAVFLMSLILYLVLSRGGQPTNNGGTTPVDPGPTRDSLVIVITDLDDLQRPKMHHHICHNFQEALSEFFEKNHSKVVAPSSMEMISRLQSKYDKLREEFEELRNIKLTDAKTTNYFKRPLIKIFKPDVYITGTLRKMDEKTAHLSIEVLKCLKEGDFEGIFRTGSDIQLTWDPDTTDIKRVEEYFTDVGKKIAEKLMNEPAFNSFMVSLNNPVKTVSEIMNEALPPSYTVDLTSKRTSQIASEVEKKLLGHSYGKESWNRSLAKHGIVNTDHKDKLNLDSNLTKEEVLKLYYSASQKLPSVSDPAELVSYSNYLRMLLKNNPRQLDEVNQKLDSCKTQNVGIKLDPVYECPIDKTAEIDNFLYCKVCDSKCILSLRVEPK